MSDRSAELILKAVQLLEPTERDEVLTSLIQARFTEPPTGQHAMPWPGGPPWPAAAIVSGADPLARLVAEAQASTSIVEGGLKVLPVRLPAADYDRLREWSRAQGFSMAVIIRTLVERFLDGQQHDPPAGPLTARA